MGITASKPQTSKAKVKVSAPPVTIPIPAPAPSYVESITTLGSSSTLVVDSTIEQVIKIGRKLYGEQFDAQHIITLGSGGSGVVYLIHYTEASADTVGTSEQHFNKSVALKAVQLNSTIADHAALAKHEFDIMALCKESDYIVRVFESVTIENMFAYTMEYCPLTLSKVLHVPEQVPEEYRDKAIQFPLLARLTIARQISQALQYMHDLDIVHLDVKSDNVLIAVHLSPVDDSDTFTAKLTDFGLSVKKGEQFELDGTTEYMAPELLQALLPKKSVTQLPKEPVMEVIVNSAADIYSFGIMLWEIITRKIPFTDDKGKSHHAWTLRQKVVVKNLRPDIEQLEHIPEINTTQQDKLKELL